MTRGRAAGAPSRFRLPARATRWISVASVAAVLSAWEAASRLGLVEPVLASSPSRAFAAGYRLLLSGALRDDVFATLGAFAVSLGAATVIGGVVGVLVGSSETARAVLEPFITVANALPKVALMPIVVLWVGIGAPAAIALGTLMASFPIVVTTRAGVRALDDDHLLVARAFRASWRFRLTSVVLPGIAPHAVAGLRVGVNYAMVGVLVAEFFAASRGVGHRMVVFVSNFEVDSFFACIILVGAFVVGCSSALLFLERHLDGWARDEPRERRP